MTHAGIIAAGDGSRLKTAYPGLPKPLIPIAGAPLCHWVVDGLRRAGATRFTVLLNSRGNPVRRSLEAAFPALAWTFFEQDTASSWESFRLVARALAGQADDFLISTVDALIPAGELGRFVSAVEKSRACASLALTDFIDDEKPLWADLGGNGLITALGPDAKTKAFATSGLYHMTRTQAQRMPEAKTHAALRQYWTALVQSGAPVAGVPLSKTLDIDRPEDLREAETFLRETIAP